MLSSKWTDIRERENERGMKRDLMLGIQQEIKDGERMLQTPGQLAALMNIRAAV